MSSRPDIVKILLDAGANKDAKDKVGYQAIERLQGKG